VSAPQLRGTTTLCNVHVVEPSTTHGGDQMVDSFNHLITMLCGKYVTANGDQPIVV
jgi:hypothetical protein